MKLVLHIGIAEAGAALIQETLANNGAWLGDRGMIYADLLAPTPNHITLFFASTKTPHRLAQDYGLTTHIELAEFRAQLNAHIAAQVAALPDLFHTMIMSSAALTGLMRRREEIVALRDLLSPHFETITLFIYVRRQDDALLTKYSDLIRRGQSRERFPEFVDTCLSVADPMPHLDYRRALSSWVDIWGAEAIVLRRFSPADFIHGDLMADVMGVVQGTWDPDLRGLTPAPDPGRMLSAPALEFLRRLHPTIPFQLNGAPNPRRRALMPTINALPDTPRAIMPAPLSNQIMGHYRASNNWLSECFAPNLSGPFFPDRPDHPEHGNLGHLSGAEASDLAAQLMEKMAVAS